MPTIIRLRVRATPRARTSVLQRRADGSLAARITAPPTNDRANRALIELLADAFSLPQRDLSIERGQRSRDKRITVTTDDPSAVQAAIDGLKASA